MKRQRLHSAWFMLGICFLGLLAAQGVRLSFGAFIQPWEQEFSVDRATISLASFVSFLVYGLTQPIIGKIVDRYGVRRVMSFSILLVGVSFASTVFVRSFAQFLIVYGLIASLGFGGASGVAASVAMTNWFRARRGLAFALIEAGFSAGQLLLTPGSLLAIAAWGWKPTAVVIGIVLSLLVFPLLLILLRSTPAEVGLRAYGADGADDLDAKEQSESTPAAQNGSIFASRAFWGLALPFFICGFTSTGMIDTHLIPFSHDHGFSIGVTSTAVGLLAAFNILGTLLSGPLADRWDNRKILGVLYGGRAISLVLLLTARAPLALFSFAIFFGIVDFATLAPTQLLASKYFSGRSIGFVFGLLSLSHQLGSALGAYLPGLVYTQTGSYSLVFTVSVAFLLLGSLLCFTLPFGRLAPRQLAVGTEQI